MKNREQPLQADFAQKTEEICEKKLELKSEEGRGLIPRLAAIGRQTEIRAS